MTTTVDTTYYARGASLVSRRVGAETVLVPVRQSVGDLESIYTLNDAAAALWERLETPQTVVSLAHSLAAEYAVEAPQAEADVRAFLTEMAALQLVEARDHA